MKGIESYTIYATDNKGLWDLYLINGTDHLRAIPCDSNSGRLDCYFGTVNYVERSYPRKFGALAGYTRVSDGKQI